MANFVVGVLSRRFVRPWVPCVLAATVLLSLAPPSFRAVEPLPAAISDEAFWKMIVDMSEPDGSFQFENFLSNELGYQYVIPRLLQGTKPGGAYLGVAPEQNFTYIAALKPRIALIIDIRRQNMIELMMYKALFEMSETRADFVSNLFARKRPEGLTEKSTADDLFTAFSKVRPDPEFQTRNLHTMQDLLLKTHKFGLRPTDVTGRFSLEYEYEIFVDSGPSIDYSTGGPGAGVNNPTYADLMVIDDGAGQFRSYLASEENYRFVRDMEKKNLIIPLVGDFAGPKTLRAVGQYLRDHDTTVTAFYLSNVEQYLFNDFKADDFYQNVAMLPLDSGSTFIRSFSGGGFGGGNFGGGPFRFLQTLSSMKELLEEFKAGRVRQYGDVRSLSQ
jgi:hypothetical protein